MNLLPATSGVAATKARASRRASSLRAAALSTLLATVPVGTLAAQSVCFEDHVIALYEFQTGTGSVAFDTSNVAPALDLVLSGDVEWLGPRGLRMNSVMGDGKAQASASASEKLHDSIIASAQFTLEAWIETSTLNQQTARIASYSAGDLARNFSVYQSLDPVVAEYQFLVRSERTDANGEPSLGTTGESVEVVSQYVVATHDPFDGRMIYVDGVLKSNADPDAGGSLNGWDDTFAFVLGNEVNQAHPYEGTFLRIAIHDRALTAGQIQGNFDACLAACENGRDDDGDGRIDFPADPGCAGTADPSEVPTACGLGGELVFALAPLWILLRCDRRPKARAQSH